MSPNTRFRPPVCPFLVKPTVSLDVIALVASSCGYYRGHIEHCTAHEFAMYVATQRGRAKRLQHRQPPRAAQGAQAGASLQTSTADPEELHRSGTLLRLGQPGGRHGRRNDPIASSCLVMRCPPVSPLFASWQWLLHTGCSLEALDIPVHEGNR
jgi:hypothetical protein